MKIKLSANSIVNISKELEEINLNHGYSIGNIDTVEKSNWTKKILGKIDKTLSYVKPISEESNFVIEYIAKAAKFLSIQEETKEKHVEDLKIHINVDSAFNNFLKLAGKKTALMIYDFAPDKAIRIYSNVENLFNTQSAYINMLKKEIYMGTNFFQKSPSEVPSGIEELGYNIRKNIGIEELGYNIRKNIGLEDATNFIVFHEASHSFEVTNYKDYGFGEASDFFKNLKRVVYILNNHEILNELNKKIIEKNEIFGINEVDKRYIANVCSLMKEIYADVGAILLQRNKDIYENNHTKEKDIKIVETIINAREKEQLGLIKLFSDNLYVNEFSHFTSSALMKVKEMYELNKIDKKILSQKEINNIVSNVLEQGLSRVLLANIKSNNENIGQLKILFSLMKINEINKDEFTTDINVLSFDDYKESIKFLKEAAGEEWVKKLNDVSDEVKENGMRSRSIWNGVFHKETYEIEKQESIENNKLLKEIEVTNYKDYGFGEASDFFKNLKRVVYILNNHEILNELNKKIIEKNEIFGINEVDKRYIANVCSLMKEIYADVGAILLQRNKDIYENNHTKEKDIKIVETIINAREKKLLGLIKLFSDNLYVNEFSYFTSSALMKVKEMYELNKIDKKILSQKEINNIVSNVLEQGLSRVLLANIKSNNENIGQLKILFSLMKINEINKDEFTTDINVLSFDDYKESIKFLKEAAGEEWVKKLNDVSDEVKENGMRSRSIWNGVFHKETYEIEKQESIENNKLLKEIDVNHSEKEIVRKIPISVSMQDISASIKKCKAEFSEKETIQKNTAFQRRIN